MKLLCFVPAAGCPLAAREDRFAAGCQLRAASSPSVPTGGGGSGLLCAAQELAEYLVDILAWADQMDLQDAVCLI